MVERPGGERLALERSGGKGHTRPGEMTRGGSNAFTGVAERRLCELKRSDTLGGGVDDDGELASGP